MGLWDLIRKMMQEDQKPEASETQKETKTETANATSHSEKKPLYDKIILSGVNDHVHKQLMQGGIEQQMDPHNICANIHFALRRASDILEHR